MSAAAIVDKIGNVVSMFAVEVITTFNRGTRDERAIATGQYEYYTDRAEAQRHADARGVEVVILAPGEQLDGWY